MKKYILNSIFLLSIMLMSFGSYAFDFIIFGNVTDDDGNPVAQQEILFRTSNDPGGAVAGTAITDGNGDYSVNLNLEGDSVFVIVETYAYVCNEYYTETVIVEGDGAEVNFVLCSDNTPECDLSFYYYTGPENPFLVYFNPVLEDSIQGTTFSWQFGDGTGSNEQYPEHLFNEGEYLVQLTAYNDVCGEMYYEDIVYVWDDTTNVNDCFADFYYMIDQGDPYTFYFYDASYADIGITSWAWDFGDGTTSTEQNPIHTYSEAGQYVVTLTIQSADVCSSTTENYVWIDDNPWYPEECQALFYTVYDSQNFLTAHFVDLSWAGYGNGQGQVNEILAWQWEFGDGEGSAEQNPTHTYAEEGEYLVSLTIYTDSCTSTFQEVVYMEDWGNTQGDCQAFFYPEFNQMTLAVQFHDLSIPEADFWNWNFGDGETSNEQNPYHVYPETGIYMVTLVSGSDSCSSEFMMEIELFQNGDKGKDETYSGIIRRAFAVHGDGASDVNELETNHSNYSIYPNPVNNVLNINFNQQIKNAQISIMNISGQTIKRLSTENTTKFEMNTSNLPSGIYFARIFADGKITTLKFIK